MNSPKKPFFIKKNNIYIVPIIHYTMELAAEVKLAFDYLAPDCVAVELAETMELQLLHAASRLPDISLVVAHNGDGSSLYYTCEPCDAAFEGLRSALEKGIAAKCIDLDIEHHLDIRERLPDPYSIQRIGLKKYYQAYKEIAAATRTKNEQEERRELYMARRLKDLSFSYERILFVCGMAHAEKIAALIERNSFPHLQHATRQSIELCTLTEDSCREVMAECGLFSEIYELLRSAKQTDNEFPPDRQKLILDLYKAAAVNYEKSTGNPFYNYHLRNTMKFVRNYALITDMLLPNLFQILTAAKACVEHNYAYETWLLATNYPHLKNIDNLPCLDLSADEVWGQSKIIRFHIRESSRKKNNYQRRKKDRSNVHFEPPGPFSICSYQPEDAVIENFGRFLQKKGTQILREEAARIVPFTSSLEDGIDTRETIRHWYEKKLYVKTCGKPAGAVGSVVIIFNEDQPFKEENFFKEMYPWKMTWIGEHAQESDMAFYASDVTTNVVGPGISRCEYGGFMMSYPPRRLWDVWRDPDYAECPSKAEVLLMAAIDYALQPIVVYVAAKPPRSRLKSFASRFGKKIVYIPIGQLSPVTINKLRTFHVLDGRDKRKIASEYIF